MFDATGRLEAAVELSYDSRGYEGWINLGFTGIIEWMTGYTSNTWGFAVIHSVDGESWSKLGDYVLADEPDSSEPKTWTWYGNLPTYGQISVVEFEVGTGKQQQSPRVLDLGNLARQ